MQADSGREHCRQVQLDLLAAAAGQQGDLPAIPLHHSGNAARAGVNRVGQRVPDELHLDPVPAVELALKRKDDQHLAHVTPHQFEASSAPGPKLRADVVNDRDATAMKLARQAKVELREIDEHGGIWAAPVNFCEQAAELAVDARQVRHHFGQSQDGNVFGVDHNLATGGAQTLTAQPEALDASRVKPVGARRRAAPPRAYRRRLRRRRSRGAPGALRRPDPSLVGEIAASQPSLQETGIRRTIRRIQKVPALGKQVRMLSTVIGSKRVPHPTTLLRRVG
jgi:hypothetical protein